MARRAFMSGSFLVDCMERKSKSAKGSEAGESTICSLRSILRIEPSRTETVLVSMESAMTITMKNHMNEEMNEPTKNARTHARNVLKKFMIPIILKHSFVSCSAADPQPRESA